MRWNDDIVNQKILGLEQTENGFSLSLTNGMDIELPMSILVLDAGVYYPIERWVTYKDGGIVRTPEIRPQKPDKVSMAVIRYNDLIREYGMDGEFEDSLEVGALTTGEDLDVLYSDMVDKARKNLAKAKEVGR